MKSPKKKKSLPSHRLVAIDVSAAELVVATTSADTLSTTPPPVTTHANTPAGHAELIKLVTARNGTARVILEATGVYSLRLALALDQAERVEVMVINPRTAKDFQRARLTRAKTDRVDALGLLDFLARMPFVAWTPPPSQVLGLQPLTRRMDQLKGERTRELARLHAVEFTPEEGGAVIAQDLQLNLAHLEGRLKALHQAALALVKAHPQLLAAMDRLTTTPGIAHTSAMKLLAELLVLPAGMKAPQWVAHAGLDPRPCESGSSINKPRHITKTGNRHLRTALFMPALVAVQRNTHIKAFLRKPPRSGKEAQAGRHRRHAQAPARDLGHAHSPTRLRSRQVLPTARTTSRKSSNYPLTIKRVSNAL